MFDSYLNYGWKFWPVTYVRVGCISLLSLFNEKIAFMRVGAVKAVSIFNRCVCKWQVE